MICEYVEDLTEQELFDRICEHAASMNRPARMYGKCRYRATTKGHEPVACFAGCLISDEEYNVSLEGGPWDFLAVRGFVPKQNSQFIASIQLIHDRAESFQWQQALIEFGSSRNLNVEKVKALEFKIKQSDKPVDLYDILNRCMDY